MNEEIEESEFGRGIVVCLVKFSEHLWNRHVENIYAAIHWKNSDTNERQRIMSEIERYPQGDTATRFGYLIAMIRLYETPEKYISHCIEIWANGASDHFYDLDERAPEPLKALASLTLTMGHGFTGQIWDEDDWENVQALWQEAALEIDRMLGVDPDWGTW